MANVAHRRCLLLRVVREETREETEEYRLVDVEGRRSFSTSHRRKDPKRRGFGPFNVANSPETGLGRRRLVVQDDVEDDVVASQTPTRASNTAGDSQATRRRRTRRGSCRDSRFADRGCFSSMTARDPSRLRERSATAPPLLEATLEPLLITASDDSRGTSGDVAAAVTPRWVAEPSGTESMLLPTSTQDPLSMTPQARHPHTVYGDDSNDDSNNDVRRGDIERGRRSKSRSNTVAGDGGSTSSDSIDALSADYRADKATHEVRIAAWIALLHSFEQRLRIRPPPETDSTGRSASNTRKQRHNQRRRRGLFPKATAQLNKILSPLVAPGIQRLVVQFVFCFLWVLVFAFCVKYNNYAATTDLGNPSYLSCTNAGFSYTPSSCGVDGMYCRPFSNDSLVFRCPTGCSQTYNVNLRWVGNRTDGNMMPWVIGDNYSGSGYRGDSWICAAAIHAGITTGGFGGCGVVRYVGSGVSYTSVKRHGIKSMDFNAIFPKSFVIDSVPSSYCRDVSWPLVPVFWVFMILFPLTRPSTALYIFCVVSSGAWQVTFFGIPNHGDDWVSQAWGYYLVTLCFIFTVYRFVLKGHLPPPHEYFFDYAIIFTTPFLAGIYFEQITAPLSNFGFTSRAFRQSETIIAFAILVPIVVVAAILQLWYLRKFGRLGNYIYGYAVFAILITVLPKILGLYLHIHHYIMALILLPLTAANTITSLLFQGFLVGLLVEGLSRWGAASPFDTAFQNLNGDPAGSIQPIFTLNSTTVASSGFISWTVNSSSYSFNPSIGLQSGDAWDSFSLVVNNVEVYRGSSANYTLQALLDDPDKSRPYYLRVALTEDGSVLDYTNPLTVYGSGNFTLS